MKYLKAPLDRIVATYLIETPLPIDQAAAVLAGEQSSGTFVALPGETDELKHQFAARVEHINELEAVDIPSLPGCRSTKNANPVFRRAEICISWSTANMGRNLATLISTLQGNLYELSQFSGMRLVDFDLPHEFSRHFNGPKYGVAGTRAKIFGTGDSEQHANRPLIGTIIKPSIGLLPDQTAEMVRVFCDADIDFIKDDELMCNPPHSPFEQRLSAVMRVINQHEDKTGKKVMYAFNISAEIDDMQRHYDLILKHNGTSAMISINSIGIAAAKKICDHGQLVIHGHRNGFGMLNRHPLLGIDFRAYQKMQRLVGIDQLHVNGIANKFWEPDDSVVRSIKACAESYGNGQPILPVISSGQWGGQAFETYRLTQTVDLLYLAGGGIAAHPDGPAAGVKGIRQAWAGAVAGLSSEQVMAESSEYRRAVEKFGKR